jgi:hypothetical protein
VRINVPCLFLTLPSPQKSSVYFPFLLCVATWLRVISHSVICLLPCPVWLHTWALTLLLHWPQLWLLALNMHLRFHSALPWYPLWF